MAIDEIALHDSNIKGTERRRVREKSTTNKMSIDVNNPGLLRDKDVPEEFRTVFIKTRYRKPGLSLKDCLRSAFEPNNETINVWSHVIALVMFIIRFYYVFHGTTLDSWSYPLTTFAFGIGVLMAMSSIAHLLNCISLSFHHIGFYLDYAAISVFSFSGAQAFYFYSRPVNSSLYLLKSSTIFLFLSALMSWVCTTVCCLSRHRWKNRNHVVRTSLFIVYFVIVTFPFTYRGILSNKEPATESAHYFVRHVLTYIISAAVNMFKIPERFFPFVFDFFGQSHHFLHLFAALGASDAFTAVYIDMKDRHVILNNDSIPSKPNACNTWILFIVVLSVNLSIVYWFARSLLNKEKKKKM